MKNKQGIILIVIVVLSASIFFGTKYFLNKDLEKQKNELEQIKNSIVYSEEENVYISVAKFNTEIMDNGMQYPLREDSLVKQDETYYYGVYEDICFYLTPVEYTGDLEKDITQDMAIYYPKETTNEEIAKKYIKNLIKANNQDLSDEDIERLITKSEELSKEEKAADENNGIFISYDENDESKFYIVSRKYKTE